jgi:hypothetical protein
MTLDASVNLLVQRQEEILNKISNKIVSWDSKLGLDGGLLTGKLDLLQFGTINAVTKKVGFGVTDPIDLLTIKAIDVDTDTVFSILSNKHGSAVIKLGIDDLSDPTNLLEHKSVFELNSTNNKTTILKDVDNSFNINHEGDSGFYVNCQNDVDIEFNTKNINRLTISKLTGNILINTIIDDDNYKLQVSGSVNITETLKVKNLSFSSNTPLINHTVDTSSLKISGGSGWIETGAGISLSGKYDTSNPYMFEVYNSPGLPSLTIDNQNSATFAGKVTSPTLQLVNATINGNTVLPQIIFKDSSQSANNRLWQIKSENSDLIIRTLDDNNNPGTNIVRFIRSAGNNDLSKIIFGETNDIALDVLTPAFTINGLSVLGHRQTGWTNIANPTNISKDLASITSDTSALAKIVRALVSDLISHGLIGL